MNTAEFTEETGDYVEVIKLVRTVTDIPMILTPEARTVIADESLVLEMKIVARPPTSEMAGALGGPARARAKYR